MSEVFFEELAIPSPDYNLGVGSGSHAMQTGAMMGGIEKVLIEEEPSRMLLYGDTNSTLAGALVAAKLHIPIAHVEAGLRSFNRQMPEEINRVVTDHLSDLLLCPSQTAVNNLEKEGITRGVHLVGDVMADSLMHAVGASKKRSCILETLGLGEKQYLLATLHRAENTDDPVRLRAILSAFTKIEETVVFPVHPRTRPHLVALGFNNPQSKIHNLKFIDPLGYLDMVRLELSARMILTDSGGIQKEAYWLGVPCITLRDETELVETVDAGWNVLAGADVALILELVRTFVAPSKHPPLYGEGQPAAKCVAILESEGCARI